MKKYIILFVVLCSATALYLSFPIHSAKHFVSIKDKKFYLDGKVFYPLVINYIISVRAHNDEIWFSPFKGYAPGDTFLFANTDSCLLRLKADMSLIKEMGFNTVRLGVQPDANKKTGELSLHAHINNNRDTSISLLDKRSYTTYFSAMQGLLDIINNAGLKVIFLTRLDPEMQATEKHFRQMATYFKEDTCILAYDLFNEPLYFDRKDRKKTEVDSIVRSWNKLFKMYAPDQLLTIGLEGMREIFEWDPNMLDVDFISFHPYEFEHNQVMNELYWYGHYVTKPWIIGETAISADNDSITYKAQKLFAEKTLKQTYDCGGLGYSWWQYKDVEWHSYLANYMGVVTRDGKTITKNNLKVIGVVKPVAEAFRQFNPLGKKDSCICLSNYYNYSEGKASRIIGYLKDVKNKPIQGGIVLAWNQNWSHSYHTVTKADGSFELLGTFPFYHWIATATLYSVVRDDISPDTAKAGKDNIPTINIGTLKIKKVVN